MSTSELATFTKPLVFINKTGFGPTNLPEFSFPYQPYWKDERVGKLANFGGYQLGQNTRFATGGSGSSSSSSAASNAQAALRLDASDKRSFFGYQAALFLQSGGAQAQNALDEYELVETLKSADVGRSQGGGPPRWGKQSGSGGAGAAQKRGPGGSGGPGSGSSVKQTEQGEAIADLNQPLLKGKQAKFLMQGVRRNKQWGGGGGGGAGGQGGRTTRARRDFYSDRDQLNKEFAVKIRSNWELIESIDLPQFAKMSVDKLPAVKEIKRCGEARRYDDALDRITTRTARALKLNADTAFVYPGCLEDSAMEQLILENRGTIYATDEVLSYLMCAPRSLKTWDLVLTRVGNVCFIDKREDAALEVLTVNETFTDRVLEKDEPRQKLAVNQAERLGLEATAINQTLLCNALTQERVAAAAASEPNPFTAEDGQRHQPITYVYKSFHLDGTAHEVVVRTEVHGVTKANKTVNVYALNEFDSKLSGNVDWRQRLDNQPGLVLANELKNNAPKIARWTCQALMSNVDQIKLGFVSRVNSEDASRHALLAINTFKPKDLAQQINMREKNMWGIVRHICDLIMNKEEGKYLLVRDPSKAIIRLYRIPMNTYEEESDEEEDEDSEDEEEAMMQEFDEDGEPIPVAAARKPQQDEEEEED